MSWLVRQEVNNDRLSFSRGQALQHVARTFATGGKEMTVRDALNSALDEEMAADPKVFLMGEEVGEYHGAYKISKGLLDKYGPQRVIDTPITEIYIASLWGGIRILPVLAVLSSFESKVKSIVTQSCPDKAEPTYEFVNQVVCTIENTSSNREIRNEIKRLCRCESVSAIDKLLKLLHNKHIVLNYDALDILLTTTSKQNNIELSLQIFKDLLISSECLSSRCYCNLAKAFANTDDCELLLKFIREISDGAFHNNVLILNRIIFGFAEARQIKKALLIFEYMKNLKCKPDLITYNTILGILGRAGQLDEMLLEIASMKEANIIPDIVTYNTLLNNLQKFGRLDLCLAYMREMDGKGLMLDLRTYTALIESFGRSGRIYEALKLFDAMKRGNVRPSVYIYWSLINNLKKMGKLETATLLLNEMNCSLPNLIGPKNFKRKNRE